MSLAAWVTQAQTLQAEAASASNCCFPAFLSASGSVPEEY